MPVLDLTRYIIASAGTWTHPEQAENRFAFTRADTVAPHRLLLRWAGDFVALTGPLKVRVTVQAENLTVPLALVGSLVPDAAGAAAPPTDPAFDEAAFGQFAQGRALGLQASTIYSYVLEVAAGQAWPFSLAEQLDALRLRHLPTTHRDQLGNNLGFRVLLEPAFTLPDCTPAATATDLPCDFAVADRPNTAAFFPVACEPCTGPVIGLPPAGAVALVTPPAEGGCVRTRFFNGMFITREDLETEQRYHRLKSKLHNRAAGAGVVWGLALGRQGSHLCVLPGYGVDCCGNDLALTTTYQVPVAALLADPAAAALVRQPGPQRLHLLLEYVECPSDPRPVHGDPCSPEVTRCEMSRIRESVRLRLVPPRDYHPAKSSAPLQKFFDELRELRGQVPPPPTAPPAPAPAPAPPPAAPGPAAAPFSLLLSVTRPGGATTSFAVPTTPGADLTALRSFLQIGQAGNLPPVRSFRLDVVLQPQWQFVGGQLTAEAVAPGNPLNWPVVPPSQNLGPAGPSTWSVEFQAPPTVPGPTPQQAVFRLSNWQAQTTPAATAIPSRSGDLTFTILLGEVNTDAYFFREIELSSEISSQVPDPDLDLDPPPCTGEPCGTGRRRGRAGDPCNQFRTSASGTAHADPTPVLPWLHPDPADPARAGDPKALLLAALGSWLSQRLVRERAGTATEITTELRLTAQAIYHAAWQLLFGVGDGDQAARLGPTLKRLLEAWCCRLLWKGPECCGDPHGVVIGCAVVEGGALQGIDPFGGRRYVIHYPLLEHWGAQFGLAPLDVTALRFFSTLCCLSGLPAPDPQRRGAAVGRVPLGGGLLLIGAPEQVVAEASNLGAPPPGPPVGWQVFLGHILRALGTDAPAGGTNAPPYQAVWLAGLENSSSSLLLLVPL
jgi:hypothetical protein